MRKLLPFIFLCLSMNVYSQQWDHLTITVNHDTVTIWDSNAMRNCAMQNVWDFYSDSNQIMLYERDTCEYCVLCDCIFDYKLVIAGMKPGNFNTHIYLVYTAPYCIDTSYVGSLNFTVNGSGKKEPPHIISQTMTDCHMEVGLAEIEPTADLVITPNPVTTEMVVTYKFPQNVDQGKIILYNLQGKVMNQFQVDRSGNTLQIPVSNLPSGTYFIRLLTSEQSSAVKKLVLIR